MSESEDPESRTEEPTEKKIRDTIEAGRSPVSRDLSSASGIFAFLILLSFVVAVATPRLTETLALLLAASGGAPLRNGADALRYVTVVDAEIAHFLVAPILIFVAAGLAAAFMQGAPQVIFERIRPDLSRISLKSGWSRIFGIAGFVELLKAVVKLTIIGAAITLVGITDRAAIVDAMRTEPSQIPALMLRMLIHLTSVVAIAAGVLAFADFAWGRFKWRRDLRMSRQELKEEFKQSEGDPFVKARQRSLAMDRARRRMMASVPRATFVVANPTHYAIALRYVREEGGAPLVVAKGTDLIALKIREIADGADIPVFEKRDLARAMYDHVEVDKMIPAEFYRPVAELIHILSDAGRAPRR